MYIDYRELNKLTMKNKYHLPMIDDLSESHRDSNFTNTSVDSHTTPQSLAKPNENLETFSNNHIVNSLSISADFEVIKLII